MQVLRRLVRAVYIEIDLRHVRERHDVHPAAGEPCGRALGARHDSGEPMCVLRQQVDEAVDSAARADAECDAVLDVAECRFRGLSLLLVLLHRALRKPRALEKKVPAFRGHFVRREPCGSYSSAQKDVLGARCRRCRRLLSGRLLSRRLLLASLLLRSLLLAGLLLGLLLTGLLLGSFLLASLLLRLLLAGLLLRDALLRGRLLRYLATSLLTFAGRLLLRRCLLRRCHG